MQRLLRVLQEDMRAVLVLTVEIQKTQVQPAIAVLRRLRLAGKPCPEASRSFPSAPGRNIATRDTSSVRGSRSTIEFSSAVRSVSELNPRPNSIRALR